MKRIAKDVLRRFTIVLIAASSVAAIAEAGVGANQRESSPRNLASLPVEMQSGVSAAIGRSSHQYHLRHEGNVFVAENNRQQFHATFTPHGVEVQSANGSWKLQFTGYGHGAVIQAMNTTPPWEFANRVEYRHGAVREWYVNGPLGLEQGFTVSQAPAGSNEQPLTIALAMSGDFAAADDDEHSGVLLRDRKGREQLRYSGLSARDANGKDLRAWIEIEKQRMLIRVDDSGARYPVVIDPFIQQAQLSASDGAPGDRFGESIAISGDTLVVGAPFNNGLQGAAYVFVKPASGWADMTQTAKLTSSSGTMDEVGFGVAISGNTIVAGAPNATFNGNIQQGVVYLFTKPAGGWTDMTETAVLTAADRQPAAQIGLTVAAAGTTVVASAPGYGPSQGAAYVFTKPKGGWKGTVSPKALLTASDAGAGDFLGNSVAMTGNTVVVGAPGHNQAQGAAYVYVKPQSGWTNSTETAELTASDGVAGSFFGFYVAIAGNTVAIGAPAANNFQGLAYVFVAPGNGWANMTQTAELVASDGQPNDNFGWTVAVAGNRVAVTSPGANTFAGTGYVFTKPAKGWPAQVSANASLADPGASIGDFFGTGIGMAGKILVIGADGAPANSTQGLVYVYQR